MKDNLRNFVPIKPELKIQEMIVVESFVKEIAELPAINLLMWFEIAKLKIKLETKTEEKGKRHKQTPKEILKNQYLEEVDVLCWIMVY